jgi:hypothetical protein
LARAELLLILAGVFRVFDLRLHSANEEEIIGSHHIFLPLPDRGSNGLWVNVKMLDVVTAVP